MRSSDVRLTGRRLAIAQGALLLAFVALAGRAAHLSLFDERGWMLGEKQCHSVLKLAPERGAIFDRDGHELALSVEAPSIYAVPAALADPERAVQRLAPAPRAAESWARTRARYTPRPRASGATPFRTISASSPAASNVRKPAGMPSCSARRHRRLPTPRKARTHSR